MHGKKTFLELEVEHILAKHGNKKLEALKGCIDFTRIEKQLRLKLLGSRGRPPYEALKMFKILLLQAWYNLSDEGAEESIADRLSFRSFCGFGIHDKTPDAITIGRFRNSLRGKSDKIFDSVTKQLDQKGLIVKRGTLVDASIIQSAVKPPSSGEQVSETDPDAGWAKKNNTYTHGYKAHVGSDEGSDLIRKATMTPGNIHDSLAFYESVSGDEASVYADKAYDSDAFREELKKHTITPHLMHRLRESDPLKEIKKDMNKAISKTRSQVEKIFGTFKRTYGFRRARYIGLEKNQVWLHVLAIAYNLKKVLTLTKSPPNLAIS